MPIASSPFFPSRNVTYDSGLTGANTDLCPIKLGEKQTTPCEPCDGISDPQWGGHSCPRSSCNAGATKTASGNFGKSTSSKDALTGVDPGGFLRGASHEQNG